MAKVKITEEQKTNMMGHLAKCHLNTAKQLLTALRKKELEKPGSAQSLLDDAKFFLNDVYNTHKDM